MDTISEIGINKIQNSIDSFVEKGENSSEKGRLFSSWVLKYMFEQSDDDIPGMIAIDGKNDNSIDAYFEEGKSFYIVQCKYNTSHNWAGIAKFIADITRLIDSPNEIAGNNDLVCDAVDKISIYQNENKSIEVFYITNAIFTGEETQKIDFIKNKFEENNEDVNLNILDLNGIKDYIDMELDIVPKKFRDKETTLILKNNFESNITCVAEVELKIFAQFVKSNREFLFYSNIRNYLKNTPVNSGIAQTFRTHPDNIWLFNNGVTMVCKEFILKDQSFLHIIEPQIVNGCQTANTIYNEYVRLGKSSKEDQKNLQGTILVKIIKDKHNLKKNEITRYTNRQNSVSGKDFFALDDFQRKLAEDFKSYGYFYEIQNKSSLAVTKAELSHYKGKDEYKYLFGKRFNNILPVKNVVQCYAAGMHFLPATASSRSGELMVFGKKWAQIFNDSTPSEPLYWLYPYAVMAYAKTQLNYNNKSEINYKRISLMFYVACYFRTLYHLLAKAGKCSFDNYAPLNISKDIYSKIFMKQEINEELLKFADGIVKWYMRDNLLREIIREKYGSDDLTNFMKSEVETNQRVIKLLDRIIDTEISDNDTLTNKIIELCNQ